MGSIRLRYHTIEFDDTDIHVRTLRSAQEYADDEGLAERWGISSATWPLFGIVWDSSTILAQLMFDYNIDNKRILELGCGIGLASLVLNHRQADITATDHHPQAGAFLAHNVQLNQGKTIPFIHCDWNLGDPRLGDFDLIIGSDVLYESTHPQLLSSFIHQQAKHTSEIIIVDPGRHQSAPFTKQMEKLGFHHSESKPKPREDLSKPFTGKILHYHR